MSKIDYKEKASNIQNLLSKYKNPVRTFEFTNIDSVLHFGLKDKLFVNCNFTDVTFKSICFSNVYFFGCKFINCSFEFCSVDLGQPLYFDHCEFNKFRLENNYMYRMSVMDSAFFDTTFLNTAVIESFLYHNIYTRVKFEDDCSLLDTAIVESRKNMDIRFANNEGFTVLSSNTIIDKFNYDFKKSYTDITDIKVLLSDESYVYRRVSNTYLNIANQYKLNKLMDEYSEFYYKSKTEYHKSLEVGSKKWLFSLISNLTCGYGEKSSRSLLLSLFFILGFALVYMRLGVEVDKKIIYYTFTIKDSMPFQEILTTIGNYVHFSIVTFTTVGYGNITPIGWSKFFSGVEMLLGITMTTIFTATLIRKMTR